MEIVIQLDYSLNEHNYILHQIENKKWQKYHIKFDFISVQINSGYNFFYFIMNYTYH
jgi:hypothetical protein